MDIVYEATRIIVIFLLICLIRIVRKRIKTEKKPIGTILIQDGNSLYLELNDESSLSTIFESDTVVFEVKRHPSTLN